MATIVTRAGKGSPLTHNEVDANFENLNSDKVETSSVSAFGATLIDDADAATARTTLGLGTAATTASTDYATAAQGALADSAVQPNDSPSFGSITVTGTVDGRDVAADGTKLDGIEAGATADQTAAEILTAIKTVDGAGSGLDADTLDGIQASSFLQGNQTITLSGDATGSGTTSIVVTVADDSHNHIISNVDGLQTALDAKLNLSGGTVTGTLNAATFNATSTTNGGFQGIDADTATTPSFTWTADLNTGIYRPAADTLSVTTAGAQRFTVGPAGQIGVGGANYGTSGQVLTSNGTGSAPSWQAAGGGVSAQTFTSSGTWTKPSSGTWALIEVWGGGGGGSRGTSSASGGGGGGYFSITVALSSLPSSVAVTIGSGGAGRASTTGAGGVGGTTTFGSYAQAYGGGGGYPSGGGGGGGGFLSAGQSGSSIAGGGKGGSPSILDGYTSGTPIRFGYGGGTSSSNPVPGYENSLGGGGGGGDGGLAQNNAAFGGQSFWGGGGGGGVSGGRNSNGGHSAYGGGGGASSGSQTTTGGISAFGGNGGDSVATGVAGNAGAVPAGGGSGAVNANGGSGGKGLCRVTIY